ncbi:MAG: U32 family peptidase [Clostridia bacterium]|nr:U32 family peptidase [Clostridia bacterium]
MERPIRRGELLSPAGDPEKLRAAVLYGADAVYLSGKKFGMRAASGNFSDEELEDAVAFCHERGVRVYVTVNVMPRSDEYKELVPYIKFIEKTGADAVIVSDPGVLFAVRESSPDLEIHISTQASAVSDKACLAWYRLGARRVVLARELSLCDIKRIRRGVPDDLELEVFIHGSMCVGYSGRCLLSNYFTGRDSNHGECAQPCRWKYSPSAIDLREEKRPDDPAAISLEEDGGETFFMSSRDMSMISHIRELEEAGISGYKIEGRVKSAYYAAVVTNAYRMALDAYRRDPDSYVTDPALLYELDSVSHREYSTGFFFGDPKTGANTVTEHGYVREKSYLATAVSDSVGPDGDGLFTARFIQRNKAVSGQAAEIISPGSVGRPFVIGELFGEDGAAIESTPHPSMIFSVRTPFPVKTGDIMRGTYN